MSVNNNVSNPRRRATMACEHGIVCNYRAPTAPGPSRNDLEIQAIRERLDDLYSLFSMRCGDTNYVLQGGSTSANPSGLRQYPVDESIISRDWRMEFPFMTIQTPSTMCLLGHDPKLASRMARIERTKLVMLTPPVVSAGFSFQYEKAV
ncbi:hypothetical protein V491_00465, partial [Pseudogymnoascus sp. VKM F-3775]